MDKRRVQRQAKDQQKLREVLCEILGDDNEVLMADGLERAAIGLVFHDIASGGPRVVYDYEACIAIFIKDDGMTEEDAREHMEFNVVGGYVGESTPVFITELPKLWRGRR